LYDGRIALLLYPFFADVLVTSLSLILYCIPSYLSFLIISILVHAMNDHKTVTVVFDFCCVFSVHISFT
jgi:hypothetical protein